MVELPGLFRHGPAEAMYGRGAALSDDGVYRYRLWRIWDDDRAKALGLALTVNGKPVAEPVVAKAAKTKKGGAR